MSQANSPEQAGLELAEILEQQLALYQQIRDKSRSQKDIIDSSDTAGLMTVLSEKQKLIAQVGDLGSRVAPLQAICEENRELLPGELRDRIQSALAGLRELLAEIVQLEDQGQSSLGGQKQSAGGKVAQLQKGKMMHKAYGAPKKAIPPIAKFKDKNG